MVSESKARTDDGREDAELMAAVARSRDQSAFSELLRRYQSDAYALALRIVGNCEAAEDIVQEVMVRVWTSASSYRGDGPVRAWLLRIIARESINAIKKIKRTSVRMKSEPIEDLSSGDAPPLKEIESSELAEALRREFSRLPELDRQLVGLHYGGGLSQQEISDALSMPQQTISNHLNKTLKTLRSALGAAGYTAFPLIASEGLSDVLSSGVKAPSGLQNRVLAKIAARKSVRRPRSTRTKPLRSSSAFLAAGAIGVVALAGVLWVVFAKQPTAAPVVSPPAATAAAANPEPAAFDWNRRWTFEKGLPEDLTDMQPGTWKWNRASKTMDAINQVQFFVRYRMPDYPLVFSMKAHGIDLARKFFITEQLRIKQDVKRTGEKGNYDHRLDSPNLMWKLYVHKNKVVTVINDRIWSASEIEIDVKDNILLFLMENLAVEEFAVKPLKESEVPEFVNDPKTYKQ